MNGRGREAGGARLDPGALEVESLVVEELDAVAGGGHAEPNANCANCTNLTECGACPPPTETCP